MRIAILTQDDGIFSYDFLNPFFEVISKDTSHKITSINLSRSSAVGRKESARQKLNRIRQSMGAEFIFYSVYRFLVNKLLGRSVNRLALKYGIDKYEVIKGANSHEFRNKLTAEKVDVIVIIAGTEIIKKEVLEVPTLGFINCHSSLLPSDKGLMPVFWSLLSDRTGFTWYTLNEGIDTGNILLQQKVSTQKSFVHQLIMTKQQAASRLLEAIEIREGKKSPILLEGHEGCYNKFPTRKDVLELKKKVKLF
jgi:methionyl-tRNA formyltransferase